MTAPENREQNICAHTETGVGAVFPGEHPSITWSELVELARTTATKAYAPYSGFFVGSAALTTSGKIVTGCNVENAGYGVTLCAECGLVSELIREQAGKLRAFVCVGSAGGQADAPVVMPCGRCRQLLVEHAAPDLKIMTGKGVKTMAEVLPDAFTDEDLN